MNKTHFGFKEVNLEEKQPLVNEVFNSVATNYDIMNDLMSLGMHRLWKKELIQQISYPNALLSGKTLLDVASGTGDIAKKFIEQNATAKAIVTDINPNMLLQAEKKIGHRNNITYQQADAQKLPFENNTFHFYTISFGLRNVPDTKLALQEAARVLKPLGKYICLEFSNVNNALLSKLYDVYSFNIIPRIGELVAKDKQAYEYLVESIRQFHTAPKLEKMLYESGFQMVRCKKFLGGVVAMHIAYKV